jgi:hypothetical protein
MVHQDYYRGRYREKTAAHVMILQKYKSLNQDDALGPQVGPGIKGRNNVAGRRAKKKRSKCVF